MSTIDNVEDITPRVQYTAAAAQTVFDYPFPIFEAEDLVVNVNGSDKALSTDYTVDGAGNDTGGNVTFLAGRTAGDVVTIYRNIPIERLTDFQQNGPWTSSAINDELDRITLVQQQLDARIDRCVRFDNISPASAAQNTMSPISGWLGKFLQVSSSGILQAADLVSTLVSLTQSSLGAILNPQTAAELSLAINPPSKWYKEGNVKRYSATAIDDGVTDASTAFTNAGRVAAVNGGEVRIPKPDVQYILTSQVNWTNGNTVAAQHGFVVRGEAANYDNGTSAHILVKHSGKHAFDCSGTIGIRFYDLTITTDVATYPKTCFFQARNSIKSSQIYRFTNITAVGSFSKAVRYNYGSEQGVEIGCTLYNNATDAGASIHVITANNIQGLTSDFITIATGNCSCIDHRFYGGDYFMNSTNATADVFKLDNSNHFELRDSFVDSRGRSAVYVDPTNGTSSYGRISGIDGENSSPVPTNWLHFGAAGSTQTPTGWEIANSYLPSVTRAIFADTNVVLDNFYVQNIGENLTHGLQCGTLQSSRINSSTQVVVTLSKGNVLIGDWTNYTITTRQNDQWIDLRPTKTWAAGTAALTVVGGLIINRGRSEANGGKVTVNLVLQAATSIAAGAGVQITGLPLASSEFSASVQVTDLTSAAVLSGGYVSNSSIFLSGWSATAHPLCVTAEYFAA